MVGFWAEFVEDAEIVAALPALARDGHYLAISLPVARIGDAKFAELTRRACDAGVGVRAWPLLDRDDGYWINETNVELAARAIDALLASRERPGGPAIDGISFDLEPAFDYAEMLREVGRTRPIALVKTLLDHVDRARFRKAREVLARTIERVRSAGLHAHAVAIPLILDQSESDDVLEDALDTPLSGIDWDEISFMAYQTPFAQLVGSWLGPSLVHSYAATAVARYGARAGIDLGIVGDAGVGVDAGDRYPDPGALGADIGAARAAGVPLERVRVYGLKGVLDSGGIRRWVDPSNTESVVPRKNRAVDGLRNGMRALGTALRVASTS
jgi:hypothetical protein